VPICWAKLLSADTAASPAGWTACWEVSACGPACSADWMPVRVKASPALTDGARPSEAQMSADAVKNENFLFSLDLGFCGTCADNASLEAISTALRSQFFT